MMFFVFVFVFVFVLLVLLLVLPVILVLLLSDDPLSLFSPFYASICTGERNPYGHSVKFDDGTSHTYTTLERPNIHFNS